jgi:hypothetical protein
MRPQALILSLISTASIIALVGCAADGEQEEGVDVDEQGQELTSTVSLPAHGTKAFSLKATSAQDVTLTVDCHVSSVDPDALGTTFKVSGATVGLNEPARDGFMQRTLKVPAGTHTLTFTNLGAGASCTVKTTTVATGATCRAWEAWHSPNPNHTHMAVGTDTSADWEPMPASGNHWGAWAPWNKVYDKPIKRAFLLHNLEHGGLVFSYKCENGTSAACKDLRDKTVALAQAFGHGRILVTADPTQPEKFAVRAWRWVYSSDCLDQTSALAFANAHYRHGREDIDADVPIPFDPTTTNVPCQDLMAAPDSCNR